MKNRFALICSIAVLLWSTFNATNGLCAEIVKNDAAATKAPIAPPRRDVLGKRFNLSLGQLFVPDYFKPDETQGLEMVIFFHGAAWCSEQQFYDARKNAVLISITVKDYGYPAVFSNPARLQEIIDETTTTLAVERVSTAPLSKVCLASFSGGYSAIREILKNPHYEKLVSDIVLADSLYGARAKDNPNAMDAEAMQPFLEYSRRAAAGGASLWFSHLYPPEEQHRGNTTTLTASYLIDGVGAERTPASGKSTRGQRLLYRADLGNFHILGYAGMTTQDHFEHFYALSDLLEQTSLGDAPIPGRLTGFAISPHFQEQVKTLRFLPEARILINAPRAKILDPRNPTWLILYALPNGNTIEQTAGKELKEGVDWHFGIQHIAAQTRRLREIITDRNIIVAYLEAGGRSWPTWCRAHGNEEGTIQRLINTVKDELNLPEMTIHLSSHSGGGALLLKYIESNDTIPNTITRITFMDANYNYNDESRHGDKLIEWLKRNSVNVLNVVCYDDRKVVLDGKPIVSETGGTFRKTEKMITRFEKDILLTQTEEDALIRYQGLDGRLDIIMHKNPETKILHTVLVGDMNGFIYTETTGTKYNNKAATFNGPLAYEKWIQGE